MKIQSLVANEGKHCPDCMDLVLKIRRGEITGVVLSCHPLEEIADEDLRRYIESEKLLD